jgi:hypothetical protein
MNNETKLFPTQKEVLDSLNQIDSKAEVLMESEATQCLLNIQSGKYSKEDIKIAAEWISKAKEVLSEVKGLFNNIDLLDNNDHLKNILKLSKTIKTLNESTIMKFINYANESYKFVDELLVYSEVAQMEKSEDRIRKGSIIEVKPYSNSKLDFSLTMSNGKRDFEKILKRITTAINKDVPFLFENGSEVFKIITYLTRDKDAENNYYDQPNRPKNIIAENPKLLDHFLQIGWNLIKNNDDIS